MSLFCELNFNKISLKCEFYGSGSISRSYSLAKKVEEMFVCQFKYITSGSGLCVEGAVFCQTVG